MNEVRRSPGDKLAHEEFGLAVCAALAGAGAITEAVWPEFQARGWEMTTVLAKPEIFDRPYYADTLAGVLAQFPDRRQPDNPFRITTGQLDFVTVPDDNEGWLDCRPLFCVFVNFQPQGDPVYARRARVAALALGEADVAVFRPDVRERLGGFLRDDLQQLALSDLSQAPARNEASPE